MKYTMPNIQLTLQTATGSHATIQINNEYSLEDNQQEIQQLIKELAQKDDQKGETNHFEFFNLFGLTIDKTKPLIEQGVNEDIILTLKPIKPETTKSIESLDFKLEEKLNEKAKKLLENSGLKYLFAIRSDSLFKLVVDGDLHEHENGFREYEFREDDGGSVQKVLDAITLGAISYISNQSTFSTEFIKKLHFTCTQIEMIKRKGINGGQFFESGLILNSKEYLAILLSWLSVDGLKELNQFRQLLSEKTQERAYTYLFTDCSYRDFSMIHLKNREIKSEQGPMLHGIVHSSTDCELFLNYIADTYNKCKVEEKNDNQLIESIIETVYNIEHLHAFKDANTRTILACLDILLMSKGFPPVTLHDPNVIDGISKKEFFNILKRGMLKTLDIIKYPDKPQFNFDHTRFGETEKNIIVTMTATVLAQKKHLGLKELNDMDILEIEQRINTLKEYPESALLYKHCKPVENAAQIIEKIYNEEQEKEDKEIFQLLNDIRTLENDPIGQMYLSLEKMHTKNITKLIFNDENDADVFAKIADKYQAMDKSDIIKNNLSTVAMYLSTNDVSQITKGLNIDPTNDKENPDTFEKVLWTDYNCSIEKAPTEYVLTFKNKDIATKFLDHFSCVNLFPSNLTKKPPSSLFSTFMSLFSKPTPSVFILISKNDLKKLRNQVTLELDRQKHLSVVY